MPNPKKPDDDVVGTFAVVVAAARWYWLQRMELQRSLVMAIRWCGVHHPRPKLSDEKAAMAVERPVHVDRVAIQLLPLDSVRVGVLDQERTSQFLRNQDTERNIADTAGVATTSAD